MNKENCALKLVDEIILYNGMFIIIITIIIIIISRLNGIQHAHKLYPYFLMKYGVKKYRLMSAQST